MDKLPVQAAEPLKMQRSQMKVTLLYFLYIIEGILGAIAFTSHHVVHTPIGMLFPSALSDFHEVLQKLYFGRFILTTCPSALILLNTV